MYKIDDLEKMIEKEDLIIKDQKGPFKVLEKKLNITGNSIKDYYNSKINYRERQIACFLNDENILFEQGAISFMVGDINLATSVKGFTDFVGKTIKKTLTKDTIVKTKINGSGIVFTEPSYEEILLLDLRTWGNVVIKNYMFLASSGNVSIKVYSMKNISSAALGGEGVFNSLISGNGILAIKTPYLKNEIIEIELDNDELKVDGNLVLAWSESLNFTVEKATSSLVTSNLIKEGFLNVYRGTGKVLLCPFKIKNRKEDVKCQTKKI